MNIQNLGGQKQCIYYKGAEREWESHGVGTPKKTEIHRKEESTWCKNKGLPWL